MSFSACASQIEAEAKPVGVSGADARLGEMADISEFCQRSLIELVSAGTKLARMVADFAEADGTAELRQGRGATGFKAGIPAAKVFPAVSQAVRRSILLLQKVMHVEWWQAVPPPPRAHAEARGDGGGGPADAQPDEGADRREGQDRLDRPEDFAEGVKPATVRRVIAGLQADIAAAQEMAEESRGTGWAEWDPDEDPSPAAKPQYLTDETAAPEVEARYPRPLPPD